jgi:iron complex transport system ATP-binding protein
LTTDTHHNSLQTRNLEIGYPSVKGNMTFTRSSITLSARKGEIIALIGPNGIGKSTLLQTLAGLKKKISGDILLGNRPADSFSAKELSQILSYVSTDKVQAPLMSVAELVAYGRFPYTGWLGSLRADDCEKVAESMKKVGISHLAGKMINEISDGERQRAMIARALAQDTPVVILDEPTAFLDIRNTHTIFHLLHSLAKEDQKTVILSTHDLNIALREMDKLWIMLESETLEGAPEDAVLQGWLNHLFQDDQVGFNAEKGEFFFRKDQAGTVMITGEGLPYMLTVKALERKGYLVSGDETSDIKITVLQDQYSGEISWELTDRETVQTFVSIYGLMTKL